MIYDYMGNEVAGTDTFDYNNYIYTNVAYDINTGLKVLYLTGDTTGMSKDVKKTMDWSMDGQSGTCTVKWQGQSSAILPKKNYSLKLSEKCDWGSIMGRTKWGTQNKYVLKANFTDFTHAVNICASRLWGQVVSQRGQAKVPSPMWNSLNFGAVDGFLIMLVINGEYAGIYTVMTHKETITKADSVDGYYLTGQASDHTMSSATSFSAHTSAQNLKNETDFEVVNTPDEDDLSGIVNSLNTCIDAVIQAGSNWQSDVANYLDVDAAFDYYIFRAFIGDSDGHTRNEGLVCYDGTKWYHTVYDMDVSFAGGGTWAGHISPEHDHWTDYKTYNKVFNLIYTYSKDELKTRYRALRNGPLREANVYNLFANYINDAPLGLYIQEDKIWSHEPNNSTASLHHIANWYRLRCQWGDAWMDALN